MLALPAFFGRSSASLDAPPVGALISKLPFRSRTRPTFTPRMPEGRLIVCRPIDPVSVDENSPGYGPTAAFSDPAGGENSIVAGFGAVHCCGGVGRPSAISTRPSPVSVWTPSSSSDPSCLAGPGAAPCLPAPGDDHRSPAARRRDRSSTRPDDSRRSETRRATASPPRSSQRPRVDRDRPPGLDARRLVAAEDVAVGREPKDRPPLLGTTSSVESGSSAMSRAEFETSWLLPGGCTRRCRRMPFLGRRVEQGAVIGRDVERR